VLLLPLEEPLVRRVAMNMRAMDRAEIYATRWREDPTDVARDSILLSRFGFICASERDGEPIAAIGAAELWPTMWSVWMFATDRWPEVAFAATRMVRRVLVPQLLETGARRAECRALASHRQAHRWLRLLGARREFRIRDFGKNGEDFVSFVWRRDDVLHKQSEETAAAATVGRRGPGRGAGGADAGRPRPRPGKHHPDFAAGRRIGDAGGGEDADGAVSHGGA
jgi:hypothetical protein